MKVASVEDGQYLDHVRRLRGDYPNCITSIYPYIRVHLIDYGRQDMG